MSSKKDAKYNIVDLSKRLDRIELKHFELEKALQNYENPNKKIFDLVSAKDLIRVQRGIYRLADGLVDIPPSAEILAQLLYGPSYISLERALAHYGCIPERVEVVTSVTTNRKKKIHSPVGTFEYQHLAPVKYVVGFVEEKIRRNSYLIATPLKALVDLIYFRVDKKQKYSQVEVRDLLLDDYRLDLKTLRHSTSLKELMVMKTVYRRVVTVSQVMDFLYKKGGLK